MKFKLTMTNNVCNEKEKEVYRSIGFTSFKEIDQSYLYLKDMLEIKPETIEIKINSVEELMELQKKVKHELILIGSTIEICNDYRE